MRFLNLNSRLLQGVILIILALGLSLPAYAQDPIPPDGFFTALADVNSRIGQNISLICSDQTDGSTCDMSNVQLDWEWAWAEFSDGSLGCPAPDGVYTQALTNAYQYTFEWQGVVYDYRQEGNGAPVLFCTTNGLEDVTTSGAAQPAQPAPTIAPTVDPSNPASACPDAITPRLTVGGYGQVTPGAPNNMRLTPSRQSASVGQIPGEGEFTVLDGPACDGDILYWFVEFEGIQGWTGEGGGGEYWTQPIAALTDAEPATTDLPVVSQALGQSYAVISASNIVQLTSVEQLVGQQPVAWTSNNGLVLVAGSESGEGQLYVYSLNIPAALPASNNIWYASTHPENSNIAMVTVDESAGTPQATLLIQDTETLATLQTIGTYTEITAIHYTSNGRTLAVAENNVGFDTGTLHIYDAETFTLRQSVPAVGGTIDSITSNGNRIAFSAGQQIYIVDMQTGNLITSFEAEDYDPASEGIVFAPNGQQMVFATKDENDNSGVAFYDLSSSSILRSINLDKSVSSLSYSPDSELLAIGAGGSIMVYDTETAIRLVELPNDEGIPHRVAYFNNDGAMLVMVQNDTEQVNLFAIQNQ